MSTKCSYDEPPLHTLYAINNDLTFFFLQPQIYQRNFVAKKNRAKRHLENRVKTLSSFPPLMTSFFFSYALELVIFNSHNRSPLSFLRSQGSHSSAVVQFMTFNLFLRKLKKFVYASSHALLFRFLIKQYPTDQNTGLMRVTPIPPH